jgi:hypothetical protein
MSDAFDTAQKIAGAIEKKMVKYKAFVRKVEVSDFCYIEIALRPPGGTHNDDVTTAYTEAYFAAATGDQLKPRALRILNDFRILMGLPRES